MRRGRRVSFEETRRMITKLTRGSLIRGRFYEALFRASLISVTKRLSIITIRMPDIADGITRYSLR